MLLCQLPQMFHGSLCYFCCTALYSDYIFDILKRKKKQQMQVILKENDRTRKE